MSISQISGTYILKAWHAFIVVLHMVSKQVYAETVADPHDRNAANTSRDNLLTFTWDHVLCKVLHSPVVVVNNLIDKNSCHDRDIFLEKLRNYKRSKTAE